MELNSVLEQITLGITSDVIASLIIIPILSFILAYFFHVNLNKINCGNEKKDILPVYTDPVAILVFITSMLSVIPVLSFIYNWDVLAKAYSMIPTTILFLVTLIAYTKQCPKCKRLEKFLENEELLKEEERPYIYRDEIEYQYSDGTIKETKCVSAQKKLMETWRIGKKHYNCHYCGYKWAEPFERNLDEANRPKPDIKRTKEKNPNSSSY